MACFLSLWLMVATLVGAVVGLGSMWWLIKWVEIIEQWRSAWFVSFDRRGLWVLIGSGDWHGSRVLIEQWRSGGL